MPTANDQTSYVLSLNLNRDGEDGGGGTLTFPASGGTTDSIAIDAFKALRTVSWPAGVNADVSLQKVADVQTTYEPDLTQDPPAFV